LSYSENEYQEMIKRDLAEMSKMMSSKGVTTVRIKNGIYEKVKAICDKENLTVVDYINSAVAEKIISEK